MNNQTPSLAKVATVVTSIPELNHTANELLLEFIKSFDPLWGKEVEGGFVFNDDFCKMISRDYSSHYYFIYRIESATRSIPAFGNLCPSDPACVGCRSFPRRPCLHDN